MLERIEAGGKLLALILRGQYDENGVHFVTSQDSPLQLGVHKRRQGYVIKPHVHRDTVKTINSIQEVLYIVSGSVRAEFYDSEGHPLETSVVKAGDTILLVSLGHGFTFLEDTKMIEVKQGPYLGTREDKERFEVKG